MKLRLLFDWLEQDAARQLGIWALSSLLCWAVLVVYAKNKALDRYGAQIPTRGELWRLILRIALILFLVDRGLLVALNLLMPSFAQRIGLHLPFSWPEFPIVLLAPAVQALFWAWMGYLSARRMFRKNARRQAKQDEKARVEDWVDRGPNGEAVLMTVCAHCGCAVTKSSVTCRFCGERVE